MWPSSSSQGHTHTYTHTCSTLVPNALLKTLRPKRSAQNAPLVHRGYALSNPLPHCPLTLHNPSPSSPQKDRDGPALIGNPDLGFGGLRQFGPGLINHVNLKVRDDLQMDDIMLVDSPGMIDSPHMDAHTKDRGKAF